MARKKRYSGPPRAARIGRFTTENQKSDDYSTLVAQDAETLKYAMERSYVDRGFFGDEARTGESLKRGAWQSIYALAIAGEIDVVICTFRARLGRGDAAAAECLLRDCGVRVEYVFQTFTDDAAGETHKTIDGLVDKLYVLKVKEQTTVLMNGMFDSDFVCGHIPFGYAKRFITADGTWNGEGKRPRQVPVPHPEHASVVPAAYAVMRQTRQQARVRDYLHRVTDRTWSMDQVKRLLTDERYTGVAVFGDRRKEGAMPALVDRAEFDAVQAMLAEGNDAVDRHPICQDYTYYLARLVRCPHCDCIFTNSAAKGGAVRYYECYKHNKRLTHCPVQRINADALHRAVLREIARAAEHHTVMHRIIASSGNWSRPPQLLKYQRKHLLAKRKDVARQIDGATDAIIGGANSRSIREKLAALELAQEQVEADIAAVEADIERATVHRPAPEQVQAIWARFLEAWPLATEEERKTLIRGLVQRVDVTQKHRASLQLTSIAETPGVKFVPANQVGAGAGLEPATSRL